MSVSQLVSQTQGISCHAWNADYTSLALCPNSNEIHIYTCPSPSPSNTSDISAWAKTFVLTEHDLLVSSIDWSPVSNKIVSCSHDRNAFVWTFDPSTNTWKPSLVILRIDRAALDVKWSPDGLKFAVASGAKCVPVCNFESRHDWWVSKMIKKHKSTVLCVAFHPNSQLIATGSSDFKCRVLSAFVSDVDPVQNAGPFAEPLPFGDVYCEFSALGWVEGVCFSASGQTLVFTAHDSSIHFVTFGGAQPVVQVIRFRELPFGPVGFISESSVVAAGHDMNPFVFTYNQSWSFLRRLDEKVEGTRQAPTSTGVAAARQLFQNKASRGQESKTDTDDLWTKHENAITCVQRMGPAADPTCSKFSTSSLDGRLVVWDLPTLSLDMAALGL